MMEEKYFTTKNLKLVNFLIKNNNELLRISTVIDEKGYKKFKFINNSKILKDVKYFYDNKEEIISNRKKDITSKDIIICNSIIKLMWYLQHNYDLVGTEQDKFRSERIVFRIVKELS